MSRTELQKALRWINLAIKRELPAVEENYGVEIDLRPTQLCRSCAGLRELTKITMLTPLGDGTAQPSISLLVVSTGLIPM